MAILINVHELSKSFAHSPLFQGVKFGIETGDRIGLIGPNGAGKSTLLKILAGQVQPDGGTVSVQRGLRIGFLEQVPQFESESTIESTIYSVLRDPHDWQEISMAQEIMAKLELDPSKPINELSGGWKKRVALARELARSPDLLLLDEPTNHLDIESILWLEEYLANSQFATMTITHDRLFLQKISNRILELDRRNPGGILNIRGDYAAYLETKEQLMSAQESLEQKLKNTLRRETEWLRRGARARLTKQQARIQKTHDLKNTVDELSQRNLKSQIDIEFVTAEKNPKRLIEATDISKSYNGATIIPKISLLITPKTRLGLLGANGCGKSTLIKILLEKEKPDSGSVFHSEHLKVSYFEQNRETLDPNTSVLKTICPEGDFVDYAGTKIHARSYLSRFLFNTQQMDMPTGKLSGGEQSRLLLARLMLVRSNVLVLDEPTNDLDITTLNILEEMLKEFPGAVILVTHDRYFLDNVTNQILAFGIDENKQKTIIRFANLEQWESWHEEQMNLINKSPEPLKPKSQPKPLNKNKQKELDKLTKEIEKAEAKLGELTEQSHLPEYAFDSKKLLEISNEMGTIQAQIDKLYSEWEKLDSSEN